MARYFLTKLSVEGFRGINNESAPLVLKFKPEAVNSVFAANGSGKSSLYEALQYAFSGSIPRLSEMQASEQPESYLANLFHSTRQSTIEITLAPDSGEADVVVMVVRSSAGIRQVSSPSGHPDPEGLLASLAQDFALLDYGKFAKFIADTALDRGRSFSSLLGLSTYAEFRRALKAVEQTQTFRSDFEISALEAKRGQLTKDRDRASQQFAARYLEVTGLELVDTSTLDESAEAISLALAGVAMLRPLAEGVKFDELDFASLKEAILGAESGEARQRLGRLVSARQDLTAEPPRVEEVQANASNAALKLADYGQLLGETSGDQMHSLLKAAEAFLISDAHWDPALCPLCESPLSTPIADHVHDSLAAFSKANEGLVALRDEVKSGDLVHRLRHLENLPSILNGDEPRLGEDLIQAAETGSLTQDQLDDALARVTSLESRVLAKVAQLGTEIGEIERTLPPSLVGLTNQVASAQSAREELNRYRSAKADASAISAQLQLFERWKKFIGQATTKFADAESGLSKTTLDGLRSEYQSMFSGIMGVGDVVPLLARPGTDEHLQVELSDFHGEHDVSARAVLSESYRNALAISVFLSAAVRHGRAPRFVVLDDVTSSFDSGHQFHLMEQIRTQLQQPNNPDGLQFIVLSHDVTLEKYFDRLGDEPGWNHQKLQGWPPFTPISAHGQSPDRLRAEAERFIRAGQIEQGAGLIRQYLEFTLQQVIRKVQIPVPIDIAVNDHMKMAGNYLDAIVLAVNLNQQAGAISLDAQQIANLTGRHAPAIVSNWISHHGTSASAVFSPPSLLGVLSDIDSLRRCFQYDFNGNGDWRFYKSLTKKT